MQVDMPQPTVRGRRHHTEGNEQRNDDGHGYGKRQVRKELRRKVAQEQDRSVADVFAEAEPRLVEPLRDVQVTNMQVQVVQSRHHSPTFKIRN